MRRIVYLIAILVSLSMLIASYLRQPAIPIPEPVSVPQVSGIWFTPASEPTPEATPEAAPEPMPSPEPVAEIEPLILEPELTPVPALTPTPRPISKPTPKPTPTLTPAPTPTPIPTSTPKPTPTQTPMPTPQIFMPPIIIGGGGGGGGGGFVPAPVPTPSPSPIPTPTPTPTPAPATKAFVKSDVLGINFDSGGVKDYASYPYVFGLVEKASAGWLRIDIGDWWAWPSNFHLFELALREQKKTKGFRPNVLGIIDHITVEAAIFYGYIPRRPGGFNLDDWRIVVAWVAARYTDSIDAYEIWNEPTVPAYKMGYQDGTPEHYAEMLRVAFEEVKKKDPTAKVIGLGGLQLYAGGTNEVDNDIKFLKSLLTLGGGKYMDAMALHAYPYGSFGTWVWNSFSANLKKYKDLWKGDIWITETGHPDGHSGSPSDFLKMAFDLFIDEGVSKIFWYKLSDGDYELSFGMLTKELSPKKVYETFRAYSYVYKRAF